MSHDAMSHEKGRDSVPRQHLRPFEAMLMKLEELDDYTHIALTRSNYPKAERHLLTADTRQCLDKILRLTLTAWKRHHKKTTLSELDVEIEVFRHLVRKAERFQYITPRRYKVWSEHINELGRMLGGWLRSQK